MEKKADTFLLTIILILMLWGFFTLTTVSFSFSLEKFDNSWFYARHQLLFGFLPGIFLGFIAYLFKPEALKKLSILAFILNIILMVLVFVPGFGAKINGAQRWLKYPTLFQPSEFLKITFLLYLASWLSNKLKKKKDQNQAFWVFLGSFALVVGLLILQRDLGTMIAIFSIGLLIYFISQTPFKHTLILLLLIGLLAGALVVFEPYRLQRVLTVLNPSSDPLGEGYQLNQSLVAIGSGGIWGIGEFPGENLGLSKQKFGFLPQPMTDSIYSIIGEELGFIGTSILVLLFILLLGRGVILANRQKNEFNKLIIMGICSWLTIQAFINISGNIGVLPLTGIPLPFFSYGSSHIITEMVGVGLLLRATK